LSQNLPTSWAWDFGDGSTSVEQNPTHVFTPGTYTVSLTVSNAAGTNTTTQQIVVNATPVVGLSIADTDMVLCVEDGAIPLTVTPQGTTVTGLGVNGLSFDPTGLSLGNLTLTASYTDATNGCVGMAQITVILESCAQLQETDLQMLSVYPNPTTGQLFLSNLSIGSQLAIYDAQGKIVAQFVANEADLSLELPLCEGIYYLDSTYNEQKLRAKIVVLGH
jgi:PKD repeat protein